MWFSLFKKKTQNTNVYFEPFRIIIASQNIYELLLYQQSLSILCVFQALDIEQTRQIDGNGGYLDRYSKLWIFFKLLQRVKTGFVIAEKRFRLCDETFHPP